MTERLARELRLAWITPILNVADVPASLRWFESLGWKRAFTYNIGGPIPGAADEGAAGVAIFAKIDAGYGQMFLYRDGQGLRGGKPVVPGGGDDMGANWNHWWLYSAEEVDELHASAVALGATIVAAPTDKPWGEREFSLAHPDGHVFRVSAPTGSEKKPTDPPTDPPVIAKPTDPAKPKDPPVIVDPPKPPAPPPLPVSVRPVGRYDIDTGGGGEWHGVLTLGAEGQPAFVNYGYAHEDHSREQLGAVQWNEATRTLSFTRTLYSNVVNQPYVLTFQADGNFFGTCGGGPAKGGPRGQSDDVPLPSGAYEIVANKSFRGVLKISGTDPAALAGTLNFGAVDEVLRDVRWDAQNHTLMFLRPSCDQAYGLTFIDQGKVFHGGFGDASNKWYGANGKRMAVVPRPVGRYNIDTGANGEWHGVLTLGAEGQPAYINYGYAHVSQSREQLANVQWNEVTKTLSFTRTLYSNVVNQPYVLTFQADGSFSGTCGGGPAKGGPRGQSDDVPLPSGAYDLTANKSFRGVLKISGTDPAALAGTLNFGAVDEVLRDVRWDAQNHTLMFLRPSCDQAYGLTFIDQGKVFHGGFGDASNKWYDANGTRR